MTIINFIIDLSMQKIYICLKKIVYFQEHIYKIGKNDK